MRLNLVNVNVNKMLYFYGFITAVGNNSILRKFASQTWFIVLGP